MKFKLTLVISILAGLGAACATPTPTAAPTLKTSPVEVSVVMGYIPNVQFAPWFVAEQKGYFAAAGIRVKYNWGFEVDGIKLVGANQADFAMLGGDQIIQARAQNIPLVYVANYYNSFPISIFSLKEKNIRTPADLVGKRVGLPAFFGATYTGWRALLYSTGIKETDIQVRDIGFTQVAAVTQGVVDAAAGYSNNEPVQLSNTGKEINVIKIGDYSRLVGVGLATNEKTIAEKPQLVRGMVGALMRGMQDAVNNPAETLDITIAKIPEAGTDRKMTEAILKSTIELWKSTNYGYVDPAAWASSYKFMRDAGFIQNEFDITKGYTNQFLQ
jgi:NitT/TauT family transport system substrate-binding protein